jgi:zinc D-Ala-D-Ala carboxypeptidase
MLRKKKYLFPLVFGLAFGAFVIGFGLLKLTAFGQDKTGPVAPQNTSAKLKSIGEQKSAINQTAKFTPAISDSAAAENVRLKDSLAWTFGGKNQRGWHLYISLIQQTVGTEAAAETPEFARAVALWQSKSKIEPTGIIDQDTLSQMIKGWQAARLNSSQYPADEQLLTAPSSDFYDPSRAEDLRKVERQSYAAYKQMMAQAAVDLKLKIDGRGEVAADEQFLKIISSFRSRQYQERLRAASPNSGPAGLAVNSPHFTGNALDIYVGGEPVSTADANRAVQVQTPAYKWLVKNASRFGFYPYFYEPWHWEYVPRNLASP